MVAPYRCLVLVCWIPFHKQKMSAAASKEIENKRGKVSSPVWQFFGYYTSDRSQTNVVCKPWRGTASVPYDKESKRYKDITEAVAYHIAKDMLPLRLDN